MRDIIGHGGGGDQQHTHYEATDSLRSTSYARVLDLVSEGEILGLANGLQSIFLDGTPVQNPDSSSNFPNITVDVRLGTQTQDYIPGFPDVESEIGVGVELRSGTPWVHAITNLALSAIRITLGVPALSKSDTTNGDVNGYNIDYQIELSKDGGAYAVVLTNSFNGKTTSQYHRSARIDLPPATTGWSIRVTRLTANANTATIADTTTVVSYTDVIDAKLRYPMSAVVGIQVDAKQFSNVPTRAYDMYGRIIQVPTNYDPVARTYAGVWDGTFKPAWTSNPAWIFRDLVLNDRYGLGSRITAAQVDKWALYSIARYCDEMVPNGKGGTEPRFTCNVYLQTQKQAYAVLQDLASIFRGIAYWGGGSVIASADMPSDPVYVYTAANVIGGKFHRVGSSKKTRATVALVSWNDMTDMGRAKVEYVEDATGIARYGVQQVNMTAFGCTSQGQAQRVGRWALATSRFETGMISFDVGLDGMIALPGQVVRIADPARMGARNGGRIHAAAGRVVTLDKAPVINSGDKLTVILPSGVSETRTVASVAGDAVTVSADWSTVPLAQSVWSVDSTALTAPTFKILSVKENKSPDAITYTITATQHEPGKFAFVDSNTVITPAVETSLDVSTQAPPLSVSISTYTVSQDVPKIAMSINCPPVARAVAYEGAYKRDNGNWIPLTRQATPVFDVIDVMGGHYVAKLRAVNSVGIASTETQSAITLVGKTPGQTGTSLDYLEVKASTGLANDALMASIAKVNAAAAAYNAALAKDGADAAQIALDAIFADDVLSRDEKPDLIQRWAAINAELALNHTHADALTVSHTAYDAAYTALSTYLAGLSPAWNDVTQNTPIVRATADGKWNDYYAAKVSLLNAIAIKTGAPAGTLVNGVLAETLTGQAASGATALAVVNTPPVIGTISSSVTTGVYKPKSVVDTINPTVSGGVGPFRFDWSMVKVTQGDAVITYAVSTVTYPNDRLTVYGLCNIVGGTNSQDLITCTVTDSKGRTSTTQFTEDVSG